MKFNLNHDPNNKTLAIPRAALQLSGLAGVSDLISIPIAAVFCCCRETLPWRNC